MTYVKPGRAAAAEMPMGQRAAQAGVGLCTTCRHPVRLHGDVGCTTGECWCNSTGADLRAGVTTTAAPTVPPSAAELAHLDVRCNCGHRRTEHTVTGSHVQCRTKPCTCRGFTPGDPDAPVAPQAEPTPPVLASPAAARPTARKAQPRRGPAEPRLATAGQTHERPRRTPARPAAPSALGAAVVVGEPDAVEEVTAGSDATGPAVTDPPPAEPWLPGRPAAAGQASGCRGPLGPAARVRPPVTAAAGLRAAAGRRAVRVGALVLPALPPVAARPRRLPGLPPDAAGRLPRHHSSGAAMTIDLHDAISQAAEGARQLGTIAQSARRRVVELEAELEDARQELGRLRAGGAAVPEVDPVLYLLWSGKHASWWRPDARGYTPTEREAGRYTRAEALGHVVASAQCGVRNEVTSMVAAPENWPAVSPTPVVLTVDPGVQVEQESGR